MAETDNNAPGGVNDPVKMRNTETAALKRIPASPNAASASSAARKTIKLKPLVPSGAGGASPAPASAPKSVAPPSILMNHKPAAPKAEEPPKFMSTNTAPIAKITKPEPEKPIPAANFNDAPTKTVSIPRLQAKMASKQVVPISPNGSGAANTATATVPKFGSVKPQPVPAAINTATATVPKISPVKPQPASAAINTATATVPKISPVKPQPTPAADAAPEPEISNFTTPKSPTVILPPGEGNSTTTQGIQKQAIDQAKMQSGLQGAKPAIKLRPSASPSQSTETLTPVSPTIKLSPKADSTVSPMPSPDSGTASKSDITVTTKIPRKTLQLKPKMPNVSNEAKLKEQGDIANQQIKSGVEEGDQTIQQAGMDAEPKPDENKKSAEQSIDADKNGKKGSEPNIIFSIAAILAFLIIGYTVFALTAQFLSIWEGKQIPVAGFQQIYQSSKK